MPSPRPHLVCLLILAAFPAGASVPVPAEVPPADFAASQYIDSLGCVFERVDDDWVARVDDDGNAFCGYPPSLSVRRASPDAIPGLRPTAAPVDPVERMARQLSEIVTTQLQDGELVTDDQPFEPNNGTAPPQPARPSDLAQQIAQTLEAAPKVENVLNQGLRANPRLCELLGYQDPSGAAPAFGSDPTRGFCDTAVPEEDRLRRIARPAGSTTPSIAPQRPSEQIAALVQPGAGDASPTLPTTAASAAPEARPTRPTRTAAAENPGNARGAASGGGAAKSDEDDLARIPAGARFVQIGLYTEAGQAKSGIDRLRAMGYPVSRGRSTIRGRDHEVILAGPFGSRARVVSALNDIQAKGFPSAFAR